ncbi:MAG TPA: flagellar hook-basal body complex protein FliE [Candidatus Binataceae bacterium]|jgi:flagellar hook-basal body complex protein FliE|nr:flagellar hook-basal body complex protein FliE [Candidatus Binataceae bacterium]
MSVVIPSQGIADLAPITPQRASGTTPTNGFEQIVQQVSDTLKNADQMAAGYAQGKVGLTDAVLASEKADTTFQVAMAIRNRALAAYQEIENLQV